MTMEKPVSVCVLVGSLRKASLNGMLANTLMSLAPSSMKLETVEIGQLPFFNQDLETAATPAPWTAFRQRIKAADAVLFVTPEYNRSVPAALKNALDVGSRPYGSSVWDRKPGAIVSCSPSAIGAFGRQSSSAAVAGVSERADHAAARSLSRPCRQAVR